MKSLPTERAREPATPLVRGAFRLFRLSSIGSGGIGTGFLGYLVLGAVCHWLGFYDPGFSVMSFDDRAFTILGVMTGAIICLTSGSMAVSTQFLEPRDDKARFVTLLRLIAFGFGAATLRVTVGPAQACLAELLGLQRTHWPHAHATRGGTVTRNSTGTTTSPVKYNH